MTAKIQMRRDTAANWTSADPTLSAGEWGFETDTGSVKIGTGAAWTATPYLSGYPTKTGTSDFDTMNIFGRYRIADPTLVLNGPSGDIALVADDGAVNLLVTTFASSVVQLLWTEGDGTLLQKVFSRVYDSDSSAWRAWTPLNAWAESASSGVNLVAKSIDVKDDANIDGDLTVDGTTTLGDAAGDHVIVQADGTNPVIYPSGDTNTGVAFTAADTLALYANGIKRAEFGPSNIEMTGSQINLTATAVRLAGSTLLNALGNRITNVGVPTATTDGLSLQNLFERFEAAIWTFAAGAAVAPTVAISGGTWAITGKNTSTTVVTIGTVGESYYAIGLGYESDSSIQTFNIISTGRVLTLSASSPNTNRFVMVLAFKISA